MDVGDGDANGHVTIITCVIIMPFEIKWPIELLNLFMKNNGIEKNRLCLDIN